MRPSSSSSSLLLMFFALTTTLPLTLAFDGSVRDTDGNLISPNHTYYILPVNISFGAYAVSNAGGAKLGKTENSNCLANVVLDKLKVNKGLPVRLTNERGADRPITAAEPTSIEFAASSGSCASSTKWVAVTDYDSANSTAWVGVGGAQDHPGMSILDGYFMAWFFGPPEDHVYYLDFISSYAPEGILNVVAVADSSGWRLAAWDNGDMSLFFGHFQFVKVD